MTDDLIVCLEARGNWLAPDKAEPPIDGRRSDAEIDALKRGILALAGTVEENESDD
jgi:hypothetical protein